ncbi:DUF1566 domain-containing protein [Massilia sp. Root418]|uniref:Lcl C-terminal domain-containing protein n=1 Tax=Massilia sp. Root418 TaxID=1736532 RepID=UPI0009EA2050|nr:DUF1566 domain-containing protein [Massilia sp. Root418]
MAQQAPAASAALTHLAYAIGAQVGGGTFAGVINVAGESFALIVAPKAGELTAAWHAQRACVSGAESLCDGLANTRAMAEAGSVLAAEALALVIDGFNDWYIPSRDELELVYRHLKPTTEENYAYDDGKNASSVPPGEEYTADFPVMTGVLAFQHGAPDALTPTWYWSSTQYAPNPDYAWFQNFIDGYQVINHKSAEGRARAVRRLPIQSFNHSAAEAAQLEAAAPAAETTAAAA